ncbi:serine protease inhibitor 5-like [Solanum verrucosum]|uniref:serine protease inhibitor 5-like n=1 Tax=Solanum verrucosum TaxID=315347 RepID=UPI0020D039A3|nr:serine protease inhibitor 5-like [Solanum verrucosum]
MTNYLFLLSLFLLPFIAFSSTFTSQNPIDLPTATNKLVLDTNGNALDPRASYHIVSIGRGAAGGDVYLGPSPNSSAPCPDGVFRYNSDVGRPIGTPVRFIIKSDYSTGSGIFENQDVNVQFDIATSRLCVIYANWKVGDYDVSLGARLLETGGTLGQGDSSWFKIVKVSESSYNLLYCPGPFVCPSCPVDECQAVGWVRQDGKRRLCLVKDQPFGVNFKKV